MQLEHALGAVEHQIDEVSSAMLGGDPLVLEKCSVQLRQSIVDFSRAIEGARGNVLPSALAARIDIVSEKLTMQRDNIARVTALVDRQVASVLPPTEKISTYGKAVGASGDSGSAMARIYRSAG